MPTDRLLKFSIPGMLFVIALIFFDYLFGGDLKTVLGDKKANLLEIVSFFFSLPIVGVIFSTITVGIMQLLCGYRIWYYVPRSQFIIKHALEDYPELNNLKNELIKKSSKKLTRMAIKKFYPYYQSLVRSTLQGEQIDFLDRRWSAFWVQVNSISVIFFSIVAALGIGFSNDSLNFSVYEDEWIKIVGLITLLIYVPLALLNAKSSRQDAANIEHLMLEKEIREINRQKNNS